MRVRVADVVVPIHTIWDLPIKRFRITVTKCSVESHVSEFDDKFGWDNGIECWTIVNSIEQ